MVLVLVQALLWATTHAVSATVVFVRFLVFIWGLLSVRCKIGRVCIGLLSKVVGLIIGWWNVDWCGVVEVDRGVGFGHGVAVCCVTIADIISLLAVI